MAVVELTGEERWAWGRNGEIRRPSFVQVRRMDWPTEAPTEVWLSIYANKRTLENGTSPIDLHMSPEDAANLAAAILNELTEE